MTNMASDCCDRTEFPLAEGSSTSGYLSLLYLRATQDERPAKVSLRLSCLIASSAEYIYFLLGHLLLLISDYRLQAPCQKSVSSHYLDPFFLCLAAKVHVS